MLGSGLAADCSADPVAVASAVEASASSDGRSRSGEGLSRLGGTVLAPSPLSAVGGACRTGQADRI